MKIIKLFLFGIPLSFIILLMVFVEAAKVACEGLEEALTSLSEMLLLLMEG